MRSNQVSRLCGSLRWRATLTSAKPRGPVLITGLISESALENPAFFASDHCIGARIASRSGSVRSSPMPISSL
ncbi:hypothetical protein ACFOWZ_37110 [Lentzea rhizosphaerae]|uniref:Uncharacterized protein n=1 Tax=Lentzea rhizosphaerae TaxID=2041025 RepID=A0ABV8C536_9PSEU